MKTKEFLISNIGCKIIIEETTRKDALGYIDQHLENIEMGVDMSDYSFQILHKDGTIDVVVGNDYDGHKIRKINVVSVVVDNPCTSIVFGNYEVNSYGVVNPSQKTRIHPNLQLLD